MAELLTIPAFSDNCIWLLAQVRKIARTRQ